MHGDDARYSVFFCGASRDRLPAMSVDKIRPRLDDSALNCRPVADGLHLVACFRLRTHQIPGVYLATTELLIDISGGGYQQAHGFLISTMPQP